MVDVERVCCMCGDVGFPDKIFRCLKCHHRFQHEYCSNYYTESSEPPEVCDWCQAEVIQTTKTSTAGRSSKKSNSKTDSSRSEYSGSKIKREEGSEKGKSSWSNSAGAPSPRTATRRYKLLKDVMC